MLFFKWKMDILVQKVDILGQKVDISGQKMDILGRKVDISSKDGYLVIVLGQNWVFLAENHKYFRKLIDSEEAGTHSQILEFQSWTVMEHS